MRNFPSVLALLAIAALSFAAPASLPARPAGGAPDSPRGGCTIHADADYRGMRATLADGGANISVGGDRSDRISSVRCDPGCVLEAYERILFGGARVLLRGSVRFVGADWNDRARSVRVSCPGGAQVRGDGRLREWIDGEISGRFYRQRGLPRIIRQTWESGYCTMQSQRQLQDYGATGEVREVPLLVPRGQDDGACPWRNGLYRRANDPAVYALIGRFETRRGAMACRVADPARLGRLAELGPVRVVEAGADLMRLRQDLGPCDD